MAAITVRPDTATAPPPSTLSSAERIESSLFSLLDVPDRSSFDNSTVRRRLSAHRRGSGQSRQLERFASSKLAFACFNADNADPADAERTHPLFAAVVLGASVDVLSRLYDACPAALGETTRAGLTPLHLACKSRSSAAVVEFLLHHCPSHAGRKTKGSWSTPLHVACGSGASAAVVRALAVKCPRALGERDRRGNAPLHVACLRRSTRPEAVRLLVALKRSAVGTSNGMGMTPVHAACLSNLSVEAVRHLVTSPEAATEPDSHGNTPLHYASSHGASASSSLVRFLLEQGGAESARRKNKLGHSPGDIAASDPATPRSVQEAIDLMARLGALSAEEDGDAEAATLHASMLEAEWSEGADMVLSSRPGLVHRLGLDVALMPAVVCKLEAVTAKRKGGFSLGAVFDIVHGAPDLLVAR